MNLCCSLNFSFMKKKNLKGCAGTVHCEKENKLKNKLIDYFLFYLKKF